MALTIFGSPHHVQDLIRADAVGIQRPSAIRFKHGVLSPGAYINNRVLRSHPSVFKTITARLIGVADGLSQRFDVVADVAIGGTVPATIIAYALGKPQVSVKKQEKGHGVAGLIDGDVNVLKGARVLLVEDMSSTFMSSIKAIEVLKEHGATVSAVLMINTWNLPDFQKNAEPYDVYALATGAQILGELVVQDRIDAEHERIVRHWLLHPEDESWAASGAWELPKAQL